MTTRTISTCRSSIPRSLWVTTDAGRDWRVRGAGLDGACHRGAQEAELPRDHHLQSGSAARAGGSRGGGTEQGAPVHAHCRLDGALVWVLDSHLDLGLLATRRRLQALTHLVAIA